VSQDFDAAKGETVRRKILDHFFGWRGRQLTLVESASKLAVHSLRQFAFEALARALGFFGKFKKSEALAVRRNGFVQSYEASSP
jgi:hypothetical protein